MTTVHELLFKDMCLFCSQLQLHLVEWRRTAVNFHIIFLIHLVDHKPQSASEQQSREDRLQGQDNHYEGHTLIIWWLILLLYNIFFMYLVHVSISFLYFMNSFCLQTLCNSLVIEIVRWQHVKRHANKDCWIQLKK